MTTTSAASAAAAVSAYAPIRRNSFLQHPAEAASRTAAPGTEEAPRSAATQPPLESNAAEARSAPDAPSAADAPSAGKEHGR